MTSNPYYNAVVVTVRTLAILALLYIVCAGVSIFIQGARTVPLPLLLFIAFPIIFFFLAKPIAWLATLGIK